MTANFAHLLFHTSLAFNLFIQITLAFVCLWLAMSTRFHTGITMTLGLAMMSLGAVAIAGWELDGFTCEDLIPVNHARALFNLGMLIAVMGYARLPICPFKGRGRDFKKLTGGDSK